MISSLKELNRFLFQGIFLSKHIDHNTIYAPLREYIANDWSKLKYYKKNKHEEYSELFIFKNDLLQTSYYNELYKNKTINNNSLVLKLIKWHPNYEGSLHGHNNQHCYFKLLNGSLSETIVNTNSEREITRTYEVNNIGYISDTIGQHKIKNLLNDYSYSLHVYFKNNNTNLHDLEPNHLLFEEQAKTST
jgi:hypothetical protein